MKDGKTLIDYNLEPFAFLNGGSGLDREDRMLHCRMINKSMISWELSDLYDKPHRFVSLNFLRPKTIIFGTTGVYTKQINVLLELAEGLNLSSVENVVLTLDTEDVLYKFFKAMKEKYPHIIFYKLKHFIDEECDEFGLIEKIEL